jgi:excisionase family DNA binding protein
MAHIMTTKELSEYLKLHEITICKHAAAGTIPALRIGRVWRFDQDAIDAWLAEAHNSPGTGKDTPIKKDNKSTGKTKLKKSKK